jgi:hypothetical protein
MAPRGLKTLLKNSSTSRLVGSGKRAHFEIRGNGKAKGLRLKGITKRLYSRIFSSGELPSIAKRSDAPSGGHWRGNGGGRRRGSAVDAQVSRMASLTDRKRRTCKMLKLTKMVFAALDARGLEPVLGQRAVCSQMHRIGTAIDLVCHDSRRNALVCIELKCGSSGARTAATVKSGKSCKMQTPISSASDCVLHRHMAQLTVTHHLLTQESGTIQKLGGMGIEVIDATLMYANDSGVDFYPLPTWWKKRAKRILERLA